MQLPARFAKYELQEFLGGGMSHVYRAVDTVIGRTVAVKILTEQGIKDEDAKQRFLQEARMSGSIQHDHIVTVHDYGEEQGYPFIVLEFLHGEDLRDAIRKDHLGDVANKTRIALEVAQALAYVHQRGIIHRDIKPENIYVEKSGRSKLMDFGIAKAEGFNLTKAGNSMGTPFYMSPEQVMGSTITPLADVYSYGMLLYELFSGVKPVTGDTLQRLFYIILNEHPDPNPLLAAGTPPNVIDLIERCTAKKPEQRIQSFNAIADALKGILAGAHQPPAPTQANYNYANTQGGTPVPAAPSKPYLIPILAVAGAAVVLLAAALSGWFYYTKSGQRNAKQPEAKQTQPVKGGTVLPIPAGPYLAGASKVSVELPAFSIDRTEVSNQAYSEFAAAAGLPAPTGVSNIPVVNVTFNEAQAFCKWAGKQLPTESQWEKAARGTDGRNYPWGNNLRADLIIAKENPLAASGPAAVDSIAAGKSPFGALHMAGNVWEWVDRPHSPSPVAVENLRTALTPPPNAQEPWEYIKGGSYDRGISQALAYEWISLPARFSSANIGFRCVLPNPE